MKSPRLYAALLLLALPALVVAPAGAVSAPVTKVVSCTTTPTSITVRWATANTPAGRRVTNYAITTNNSQVPRYTYGRKIRSGTVRGLTPRTAYRVTLSPRDKGSDQAPLTCLAYTKLISGKSTTPMREPLVTSVVVTDTTISITWEANESATSALPASYDVSVGTQAGVNSGTGRLTLVPEPLSTTSYTFTGLSPGTAYYVGAGTVNAWGEAGAVSSVETSQATTTSVTTTSTTTVPAP